MALCLEFIVRNAIQPGNQRIINDFQSENENMRHPKRNGNQFGVCVYVRAPNKTVNECIDVQRMQVMQTNL